MFKHIFFLIFFICTFPSLCYAQSSFEVYLDRCQELRPEIEEILREEGLPEYFFYLALAESGCDPDNKSSKNALGLFQLVPHTFEHYSKDVCSKQASCPIEYAYDPLVSTRVAARYIKSLYLRFNKNLDWTVAAYNAGGTNLMKKTSYYHGMDIEVVRKVYPQAYYLAMKVKKFSCMDKKIENS